MAEPPVLHPMVRRSTVEETRIADGFLKIFHETNLVAWGKLRQNHGEVPISLPDFGVQAMQPYPQISSVISVPTAGLDGL